MFKQRKDCLVFVLANWLLDKKTFEPEFPLMIDGMLCRLSV